MISRTTSVYDRVYKKKRKTKTEDRAELYDYSDVYVKFIQSQSGKKGFGGIIWIIGGPGSGKSCLMCIHIHIFLTSDPTRTAVLYQAPESLLSEIKKSAPKEISDRISIIHKFSEVKDNALFCFDEGYLAADAKEALRKDPRNFIKSLTTIRHHGVFTILNSLDDGILKGFRKKAQFEFFKLLPDGFIEESSIKFMRKYQDIIAGLYPEQAVFRISHHKFIQKGIRIGVVELHKDKYCPWYTDGISRSFENEEFDAEYRREKEKKRRMEKIIKMLMNTFGERLAKSKAQQLVEGFLRDEMPDVFWEFQEDITKMIKIAYWRLYKKELLSKNKPESEEPNKIEIKIPQDNKAPEWFGQYYLTNQNDPIIAAIMKNWVAGLNQRDIADETEIGLTKVNQILKQYREGNNLLNDDLRLGYAYEYWICFQTGAKRGGAISEPDLWFLKNSSTKDPGECKLLYDRSKSITFYQIIKGDSNKTLKPSYEYCKANNIPKYPLFFRNPRWGNFDMLITIETFGENKITVFKSEINTYVESFSKFNPEQFFELKKNQPLKPKIKKPLKPEIKKPKLTKGQLIAEILLDGQAKGRENISIAGLVTEALETHFGPEEIKELKKQDIKQFILDNIPEQLYFGMEGALDSLTGVVSKELDKKINQAPKKGGNKKAEVVT